MIRRLNTALIPALRHALLPAVATAAALLSGSPVTYAQTAPPTATPAAPAAAPSAEPASPDCVAVEVRGVKPKTGRVLVAAYADEASFGKKPLAQVRVEAGEATTVLKVCGLAQHRGSLALIGFQDLDGDNRMGRNLIGMPTEPWGSSGKVGTFGPTWPLAAVPLDGQPIVVQLVG